MMVHLGYQYGQGIGFPVPDGTQETFLRSITYGIGGAMKVHLFSHWKIGGEGFVSTMPLKSQGDGSNIRLGWGGMVNEYYLTWGKVQPFIGITLGGGSQRATHVYSESGSSNSLPENPTLKDHWEHFKDYTASEETYPAQFTKRGLFVLDPSIGVEVAATQKLHVLVRADWLLAIHRNRFTTPSGPRLYVGLMFAH